MRTCKARTRIAVYAKSKYQLVAQLLRWVVRSKQAFVRLILFTFAVLQTPLGWVPFMTLTNE